MNCHVYLSARKKVKKKSKKNLKKKSQYKLIYKSELFSPKKFRDKKSKQKPYHCQDKNFFFLPL